MIKRIFDVIFSMLMLVVLTPIFILLAQLVRYKLGSPIFFKQARPGLNGIFFNIFKFRTMTNECDLKGVLLSDKERLTKFGRFLRSTSLDELPELWNVLKGEMSLVGPRPLLKKYLPFYSKEQTRRHEVKSGITGWAQVNGRNGLSWEEKFKMDIWYVDNRSLWLDLKILFLTVGKVITRDGVSPRNSEIMPRFDKKKS
jgi:lipopolysaccharide/colanic/teichoic acid biosynthesis glycosyltransferase